MREIVTMAILLLSIPLMFPRIAPKSLETFKPPLVALVGKDEALEALIEANKLGNQPNKQKY